MHRATRFPNVVEVAIRWPSSLLLIAEMHALCSTVRILALLLSVLPAFDVVPVPVADFALPAFLWPYCISVPDRKLKGGGVPSPEGLQSFSLAKIYERCKKVANIWLT